MLALALSIIVLTTIGIIIWKPLYTKFFSRTNLFELWEKYNNKYKLSYVISTMFCIVCLGLYIGLRWSLGLENVINYNLFNQQPSEFRSANISIVMMLDLCSILGFVILLLKIFDNKKKILLRPISYLSVLGGYATLFFTIPDLYLNHPWDARYFLFGSQTIGVGDSDEPLMFLMHYWMVFIGLQTIVREKPVNWIDVGLILGFIALYATYIQLSAQFLHIYTHVTATVIGDFELMPDSYYQYMSNGSGGHPSYKVFIDIYGVSTWWAGAIVSWVSFAVITLIIIAIRWICYLFNTRGDRTIIIEESAKNDNQEQIQLNIN